MKHLFIVIFLLFISAQAFAQLDPEKALYLQKIEKYHRMKRTGTALTIVGTALSIAGIVTMANATTTTTYGYGSPQTTTEGNPGAGLAAYLVGSACAGAGVPLWIIGGVNEGRYQRKFDALSVGANVTPRTAGLTLRYRF
jgi:hypothetical protein